MESKVLDRLYITVALVPVSITTFVMDIGPRRVVQTFFQKGIFLRQQRRALELSEEEKQEQAQEAYQYTDFL